MNRVLSPLLWTLLLSATVLAGCADGPGTDGLDGDDAPAVDATSTTGGIRGVVVDESITPITGATVTLQSTGASVETDDKGAFVFNGLEAGNYFVSAAHPLYDTVQQSVAVEAGVDRPPAVRFQLTRQISTDPYMATQQFNGYISCSANLLVPGIGGVLSEECGEGVGIPGFGRVGGNPDNNAQIDFNIDSGLIRSLIVEAVWEPSLSVGVGGQSGGFNMGIYTDFNCDPVCGWDKQIDRKNSGSPIYLRNDDPDGFPGDTALADVGATPETQFSTFTWASSDETGVLLEQSFEVFVTASYALPMPEGWSLVNGDKNPF